ncbi:hypothetical protein FPV67DRAFT_94937 [Lyophyllum atratum]|nr:hypothetical protein FPV67DRAFT_94937 [Lyophyllum atratum]
MLQPHITSRPTSPLSSISSHPRRDMSEPAITTSRSILMHTSLAYLSPEIQTLDSILQDSFTGKLNIIPARLRIPTELLLIIRNHLLPAVTAHLFERSTQALAQYESFLRKLLCQECLSYYQEVYGPDIWGWEQFTGACSCRVAKDGFDEGFGEHTEKYRDLWSQEQSFPNCSTWLELYLSFESSRLADYPTSFHSIWDVVSVVLGVYGCQLKDNVTQSSKHRLFLPFQRIKITVDIPTPVTIVPATSALPGDARHSAPAILHRADRDLCLSFAYEMGLEIWRERSHSRSRFYSKFSPTFTSKIESQISAVFASISRAIVAALSLPLTFATIAMAVVCYYSNSRALRIL